MSEDQLKAFWEAIQADTALQQKLQGITDPDALVVVAKEAGFTISVEDLPKAESAISALSEEDLKCVVGGNWNWKQIPLCCC